MDPLFKILPEDEPVQPGVIAGREVIVNLLRLGSQEVTASGATLNPWNELRNLRC